MVQREKIVLSLAHLVHGFRSSRGGLVEFPVAGRQKKLAVNFVEAFVSSIADRESHLRYRNVLLRPVVAKYPSVLYFTSRRLLLQLCCTTSAVFVYNISFAGCVQFLH